MLSSSVRPLVGDLRQLASVRRIVLDDGAEQGVRALAFSTGGGLDFWVMAGRALDIGPLWWRGLPLAWQAPHGFVNPALGHAQADGGRGIDRALSGLLLTCGLDHVRQPEGLHPLHGQLQMTPARVIAAGEDWQAATPVLYVEGEVVQSRLGAETLRLHRRIEAPIGGTQLTIRDTVTNDGVLPQAHDLLYHFNLGYPGIATGSRIELDGRLLMGPLQLPSDRAAADPICVAAGGPDGDAAESICTLRTPSPQGEELVLQIAFDVGSLPYLQLWHDLRARCGLLAIEPCATRWLPGGASTAGPVLAPGESRNYRVSLRLPAATANP